jgi:poly-beta-1,6-N-acetyl-D-glucosamine synthase
VSPTTTIFVIASGALLYAYALYPLILMAMAKRRPPDLGECHPRRANKDEEDRECPNVSVIIPFHNEERWVARKLKNTLSWDYPAGRCEIVAVSDGSEDQTNHILDKYQGRIRIVAYHPRQGKPTALNKGVAEARGDILVFSDANVLLEPKSIRAMVARYHDPSVGGVSGNVALKPEGGTEPLGEGLYMRYERLLYTLDSAAGTMVGADGAFFSMRRDLFAPLESDTIVDDFALALEVVAQGRRVVYEPDAQGVELVIPDVRAEFRRKVRMIAGGYQALWRFRHLLNPFRFPTVTFQLLSHKLMRWMVPFFLVTALISSLIGAHEQPILTFALLVQACFYGLAALGWASPTLRRWAPVYVPYYFCAVNSAAAGGFWRFLRRRQSVAWQKVSR